MVKINLCRPQLVESTTSFMLARMLRGDGLHFLLSNT